MPEASVNENGNLLLDKGNIWFSGNVSRVLLPTAQLQARQHREQASFKPCSLTPYSLHCPSSISGFEVVDHCLADNAVYQVGHA